MMDRFPEGAYIEDGLLIIGDEAWTPAEFAASVRARPDYSKTLNAIRVRRWRARHPDKARESARRRRAA